MISSDPGLFVSQNRKEPLKRKALRKLPSNKNIISIQKKDEALNLIFSLTDQ